MKATLMRERAEQRRQFAGDNVVDVNVRVVERHLVAGLARDGARLATDTAVKVN
jgi:hypothetical protein